MKDQLTIVNRIRSLRQQLGYSQEYMAELLGISQQTYSNIENNPERLTLVRLKDISAILQVDFMTFLTDENNHLTAKNIQPGTNENLHDTLKTLKESIALYEGLILNLKQELEILRNDTKQ